MIHDIQGFELSLDTTNPETPKFISPVTGEGQRASYTDVLLIQLIKRVDRLIEMQSESLKVQSETDEHLLQALTHPDASVSSPADSPTQLADPKGEPEDQPEATGKRSSRSKKTNTETE